MSRRRREPWADEMRWAEIILTPLGCTVERSMADYEIAKVKGEGVSLVIYPHRTTALNHHARVRDNGSKDKVKAADVMRALDEGRGLPEDERWRVSTFCTFSHKSSPIKRSIAGRLADEATP